VPHPGFLLCLFVTPEDGVDLFFGSVGWVSTTTQHYISEHRTLAYISLSDYFRLLILLLLLLSIIIMNLQPFVEPWPLFSVSWSYTHSVGLLGRRISQSQGRYLPTEQHKHRINAHNTAIHVLNGIWTHDPNVRASEESSCLFFNLCGGLLILRPLLAYCTSPGW
jgi:hypothetical protein